MEGLEFLRGVVKRLVVRDELNEPEQVGQVLPGAFDGGHEVGVFVCAPEDVAALFLLLALFLLAPLAPVLLVALLVSLVGRVDFVDLFVVAEKIDHEDAARFGVGVGVD